MIYSMLILTIEPPRPVDHIQVHFAGADNVVIIRWKSPKTIQSIQEYGIERRNDIKFYEIAYQVFDSSQSEEKVEKVYRFGNDHEFNITGLLHGKTYRLRIRAVDQGDQVGQWSNYVGFKTRK